MKRITRILVLTLAMAIPAMSYAKQLLINPDFEDGDAHWDCTFNPNNWSAVDTQGGKKGLRCWWDGGMRQMVAVTPRKAYEFKGDVFVPANGDKNWNCWITMDWYDANKRKLATAWSVSPNAGEREKWISYGSGKRTAPKNAAFVCIDFGVYQNKTTPANPIDFANFSLEDGSKPN